MKQLVSIQNNKATTTSNIIADVFNKRHDNIIAKIESLEIPDDFNALNFKVVEYLDSKGEKRKSYEITRDGFTLLAMGFTGKRAMEFKLAYINAFNKMEIALSSNHGIVPVRPHTRSLPSVKKEIVLSETEHKAIGGIVKKCVSVAIKESLGMFLSPQAPIKAELKPAKDMTNAERKLAEAIVQFGLEKERRGTLRGMLEGAMDSTLVDIMKQAKPL